MTGIHEVHEISRSIGQPERHHGVFKQSVSSDEGCLQDVCLSHLQLVITGAKVNLGEDTGSTELIKKILNLGQGVLILDGYVIQRTVVHTQTGGTVSLIHEDHWRSPW